MPDQVGHQRGIGEGIEMQIGHHQESTRVGDGRAAPGKFVGKGEGGKKGEE